VVAIARVRRESSGETFRMELRPDPFDRRPILSAVPRPTDPDFIPNEYGTGVVVDSRGLILTAYHVLGEDSDYYITTSDRKVYKAVPKAADPRSDLAVLAIEAADLVPISLGNAAELKKGISWFPWATHTQSPATDKPAPLGVLCRISPARPRSRPASPIRPAKPPCSIRHADPNRR